LPYFNFILAVTEGESGENQYGADPKDEAFLVRLFLNI
jgi:hypothetical protein